jgi:hypothetical protein
VAAAGAIALLTASGELGWIVDTALVMGERIRSLSGF